MSNLSKEQMLEMISKLEQDNASLRQAQVSKLTFKVSPKGGLSVYGMGKWPVTLYKTQWVTLLSCKEGIEQFIKDNDSLLTIK